MDSADGHPALPFGDINVPTEGASVNNQTPAQVAGWALSEDGIEEIAIYIDRKFVGTATLGIVRPDVAQAFPKIANSEKSGWQASVDLTRIGEGRRQLIVQARTKKGAIADLGKMYISVIP